MHGVVCCVMRIAVLTIGVVAVIAMTMSTLIVCVGVFCFRGYVRLSNELRSRFKPASAFPTLQMGWV